LLHVHASCPCSISIVDNHGSILLKQKMPVEFKEV
jgi:hypothetical protein